jgi:hypothetical protein
MSSQPNFGESDRRQALSGPEQHEFLQQMLAGTGSPVAT